MSFYVLIVFFYVQAFTPKVIPDEKTEETLREYLLIDRVKAARETYDALIATGTLLHVVGML